MRCDLITPNIQLRKSLRRLQESWEETQKSWSDSVSDKFQSRYLDPIIPQMQLVNTAVHELLQIVDDAAAQTRDDDLPK